MKFYTNVEKQGNTILWRGYENGRPFNRKVKFKPTFYLPTQEESGYKSLIGDHNLKPRQFETMREAQDFVEKYKDVEGIEIFGNTNYVAQFIQEKYPGRIQFDTKAMNMFMFDIEVDISTGYANIDEADKPITSIAAKSSKKSTYWIFTIKDYDKTKTITDVDPDNIMHVKCETEEELILKFIRYWVNDYPDLVTGWNVEFFDIAYIVNRILRLFGEEKAKQLSPWGQVKKKTVKKFGRDNSTYVISGVPVIDYMDAFKKFGAKYGTQESYKLDHIAHVVLGEKKLSYEEYGSLTELYEKNPQLYFDYNIQDTRLIQRFEDEIALMSLTLTVAYGGGVNYNEAMGTVGIWDTTLYRRLMGENIVPFIKRGATDEFGELVGGYVKDPVPGMKRWIVSYDLNSLYPHIMMQYNMSPETYIRGDIDIVDADMVLAGKYQNNHGDEYSVAANGAKFSNKKRGVIPRIIEEYYARRSAVKKEMIEYEKQLEDINNELEKRSVNL